MSGKVASKVSPFNRMITCSPREIKGVGSLNSEDPSINDSRPLIFVPTTSAGSGIFDDLIPGKYEVRIIHENYKSKIGDTNSIWTGEAVTHAAEVELK